MRWWWWWWWLMGVGAGGVVSWGIDATRVTPTPCVCPEQAAHTQSAATDALRERLDGIDANIGRLDAAVRELSVFVRGPR